MKIQSRNNIYELSLSAHQGFGECVINNEEKFEHLCSSKNITIFGEWVGKGIKRGVAISELEVKSFFVFAISVGDLDELVPLTWVKDEEMFETLRSMDNVYPITDFDTYKLPIDFSSKQTLEEAASSLEELTNKVEQQCPVAKEFGINGVGEGIVWTCYWRKEYHWFKIKGEKHKVSGKKDKIEISPLVLESINNFLDYAVTYNRVQQGIQELEINHISRLTDLIIWVVKDIEKEEMGVIIKNRVDWSLAKKRVGAKVKQQFDSIYY